MPISLLIAKSPIGMALAIFSTALFAHQFWSTILQTLAADIFPSGVVGSVAGLMGAVGSFGAMLFDLGVGEVLTRTHSYSIVLMVAALFHPIAYLVILKFIPKIEPITVH
jgi:MFS transporter, ACS family, hexuronate transporter